MMRLIRPASALAVAWALTAPVPALADPLPSWNDGAAKTAIVGFVEAAATPNSPGFVPEPERIAVFDNDGTLWAEQPLYFQLFFALDRAKELAAADPGWASTPTLKAAAEGDLKTLSAGGEKALIELVTATHSGLTVDDFVAKARDWIATATHPKTGMKLTGMVYQPMLELLSYLRGNGFKTYIVSGGGVDFMRAFADEAYGIPPEQVIGSMGKAKYEMVDGKPVIWKDPGIAFIDDKEGKPLAIARQIGRRPVFVAGNSDGDFAMLEWGTSGPGPRLGLIVHHTDAAREWAYDRDSHVGRLVRGLDEGPGRGWLIVDMEKDWSRIYPAE